MDALASPRPPKPSKLSDEQFTESEKELTRGPGRAWLAGPALDRGPDQSGHYAGGLMDYHQPPDGWTLPQIRDVSGDARAEVLSPDRTVVYYGAADEVLRPTLVLGFGVLCIVKVSDNDHWYMGSLNDDGSIICWSAYDELYEALRGL
ncbi:hypothetical protein ACFWWC_42990 [Streptomyces sp. NPDC058642]|uniref:hypothetical protein n=1 Tax=Streptomyces sp. NPDC058642 TaxID=3346572 RepID=UPI00365A19C9